MADKATFQKFKDITAAEKAEMKKKYPEAIVVIFPTNEAESSFEEVDWTDTANFIITPPDRSTMDALERYGTESKIPQFKNCLKKNCVLGGDMEMLEPNVNEFVYRSLMRKAGSLIKSSEGAVKKL